MVYLLIASIGLNILLIGALFYNRLLVDRYRNLARQVGERGRRLDRVIADMREIIRMRK